jgi:hypothetical protein
VTSSSLEVLAGLALSTEEYVELMLFKDGRPSQFYQNYVKDIQAKIAKNAAAEFICIWREHQRLQGAKARTTISDELSSTLNNLQTELEGSDMFDELQSRMAVLQRAIPQTLVEKVGLETLMTRLPQPYQRALFSSWVASRFVSLTPSPRYAFRMLIPRDDAAGRYINTVSKRRAWTSFISPGNSRAEIDRALRRKKEREERITSGPTGLWETRTEKKGHKLGYAEKSIGGIVSE